MSDSSENSTSKPASKSSPGRTFAEWVTLVVSALIVGGLALFLVVDATRTRSNLVGVQTRIDWQNVALKGERWVLPIEVRNDEQQNLREVHVEVTWQQDNKEESREVTFDYVSAGGQGRVYLWFERDPRELKPEAQATYYLLH